MRPSEKGFLIGVLISTAIWACVIWLILYH